MEPFLTEEQFKELDNFYINHFSLHTQNERFLLLKGRGWIKKTKLEEYIEYYKEILLITENGLNDLNDIQFKELFNKGENAIQELQEKIREYEDNKS